MVVLDKTLSALVVAEEEVAVASALEVVLVVVEVLETVLTQEEKVMVLKEDEVHLKDLVQVAQHL